MSQQQPTLSKNYDYIARQCALNTPEAVINAIAVQYDRSIDAAARIAEEGLVVRDMRGSVIPHPAIQIEKDSIKIYTDLLNKHKDTFGFSD